MQLGVGEAVGPEHANGMNGGITGGFSLWASRGAHREVGTKNHTQDPERAYSDRAMKEQELKLDLPLYNNI